MKKKYESDALKVCHESAQTLFKLGVINANEMKEFDNDCISAEQKNIEKNTIETPQKPIPVFAASK